MQHYRTRSSIQYLPSILTLFGHLCPLDSPERSLFLSIYFPSSIVLLIPVKRDKNHDVGDADDHHNDEDNDEDVHEDKSYWP